MRHNGTGHETSTRRDYLKYSGVVVGSGLLAGCLGGTESSSAPESTTAGSQTTDTAPNEKATTADGSYSVTMAPMGAVAFDAVPERIFTRLTHLAGMAFALGRGNDVTAMHAPDYYHALWNQFTPRLEGVSLDWTGLYSSWETSKEKLYELDSDVHLADPASVFALENWNMADIEEISENVGPWFGNNYSDRHAEPPAEWVDDYQYYGLWEIFEKVATVFREVARYEVLAEIRAGILDSIESSLPPDGKRPTVVMITAADLERDIYAYTLNTPGFLTAHTRPLGPQDAFDGTIESGAVVDFEALLEADPDVILFLGGIHPDSNMQDIRETLRADPVASEITAVQNDRVHPLGARYQGPILNLFQLEMSAKQLYPEQFGEWPTYVKGPYPEIPESEQMFDRQRVAEVVNGDI